MPSVNFSPIQGRVADYVLNHPTSSPFKQNNITFHIDGKYMNDFTDKGIKSFVKKHGKDLSYKEVGTFIQSAANNASQIKGATFDLEDKELGLYKKDKIGQDHIRTGFTLEAKSSLPSQGVVFFDATQATHPLLDAENAIKGAEKEVKNAKKAVNKAEDKYDSATWERQQTIDFLGKNAPKELTEKQSTVQTQSANLKELNQEKSEYATRLAQLEEEHNNQTENPASGLDQGARWKEITSLKRAIRGIGYEIKDTESSIKKSQKDIDKTRGPLSFMGVGSSLKELDQESKDVAKRLTGLNGARKNLNSAQEKLDAAQSLRDRILSGKSIAQPKPPVTPTEPPKPPVAQEPPVAPAEPPKPPVAQEPPVAPAEPPKPPVAQEPPVAPAEPPKPPVAQEPPATQPPPQTITPGQPEPPVAQPPAQVPTTPAPQPVAGNPGTPAQIISPGQPQNPSVISRPIGQPPAPVQQPVKQPAQPPVQQPATPPVNDAPKPQPAQPAAPVDLSPGSGIVSRYTVKQGDTLSSIAKNELGDFKKWTAIADMNREVIGNQNHWIFPGQVLKLPPLQPLPTN